MRKGTLSGRVSFERPALGRPGDADPFVSAARLDVKVREADLRAHTLTIETVGIEALDLKVRRDARGARSISLEVVAPRAGPTGGLGEDALVRLNRPPRAPHRARQARLAAVPSRRSPRASQQIRVERVIAGAEHGRVRRRVGHADGALALTNLRAQTRRLHLAGAGAGGRLALSTGLPGGGTLEVKGPVTVAPFDSELTIVDPQRPRRAVSGYIPIPARLSGRYNGDSRNRIALRDGRLVAQSKGNSWAQNVEIREPGAPRPAIRVERMDLVGIDFDWPPPRGGRARRASGGRASRSSGRRRLVQPAPAVHSPGPGAGAPPPARAGAGGARRPKPKSLLETMRLDFGEIRIEDGVIRFLDRTTRRPSRRTCRGSR